MKTLHLLVLCLLLFIFAGCSPDIQGSGIPATSQNSNYSKKVNMLKEEVSKFAPSKALSPKEVNEKSKSVANLIKDILQENQSITATPTDILGTEKDYYIKFSPEKNIRDTHFRFIEFGNKQFHDGGTIDLYVQMWKDNIISNVQNVNTITQTASALATYSYYDFVQIDDNYFANVITKVNGAESKFLKFMGYKLDGVKLTQFDLVDTSSKTFLWDIKKSDGIGIYDIYFKSGNNEFKIMVNESKVEISAIDNSNNTLSTLKIEPQKSKFMLQEIGVGSVTPSSGSNKNYTLYSGEWFDEDFKEEKDIYGGIAPKGATMNLNIKETGSKRISIVHTSSLPSSRIAAFDVLLDIDKNGIGSFMFEDDGFGNKGSGTLEFKNDKIIVNIKIEQRGNGMWNIFEGEKLFIRKK